MLENVTPLYENFQSYFFNEIGHDFCKVTTCGAGNYALDILAEGETEMIIDFKISRKSVEG